MVMDTREIQMKYEATGGDARPGGRGSSANVVMAYVEEQAG